MLELYQRIRQRRKELGMSQEELAKKLGYKSRSSVNKIESGENDIPQSKIVAFAEALSTTPEYLMGWFNGGENDAISKLVKDFNSLSADGQNVILEMLNSLRVTHSVRVNKGIA